MSQAFDHSDDLLSQASSLLSGENDPIANAANLSALIFQSLEGLNWAGFYFLKEGELVVGPFQGKPACVRIPLGRGVCGRAAETRQVLRVFDVDAFDDHIVCDAESRSEIVLPLVKGSALIGVLDLDSPETGRFSEDDEVMLKALAEIYVNSLE
ncbi:MAG TPA: GAF domain-containing protein [Xanthomonadales bacterium]|nr:GAF domain-containing protein [Xanthomonadales bacterium]